VRLATVARRRRKKSRKQQIFTRKEKLLGRRVKVVKLLGGWEIQEMGSLGHLTIVTKKKDSHKKDVKVT